LSNCDVILAKNLCCIGIGQWITQKLVSRSLRFSIQVVSGHFQCMGGLLHRKIVTKTWKHWGKHVLFLPGVLFDALLVDTQFMVDGVDVSVRLVVDGVHLA